MDEAFVESSRGFLMTDRALEEVLRGNVEGGVIVGGGEWVVGDVVVGAVDGVDEKGGFGEIGISVGGVR